MQCKMAKFMNFFGRAKSFPKYNLMVKLIFQNSYKLKKFLGCIKNAHIIINPENLINQDF